ncbi:MAG TPA: ABC transporter permease [Opitutaceae bacterium]|jgi:NitT/TauT family transport system permease protein
MKPAPASKPQSLLRNLMPVATGVGMIAAWYAVFFGLSQEQRFLLPAPHQVARAFVEKGPALWSAALNTGAGAVIGFAVAVALSFVMALILSLSPLVRASLYPYLMIMQMTPIIVMAPILILWVGPGLKSVTIITFLICFFPMVVNTTQGLISTDRNLVDFFRMCKATKMQEIFLLRVPSALPYFFTGLRIAGTLATIGAIVGDVFAGNSAGGQGGLGFLTIIYSAQFQIGALFATAAVSCLLGFVFVAVVIAVSWLALHKWHDSFSQTDV